MFCRYFCLFLVGLFSGLDWDVFGTWSRDAPVLDSFLTRL